MRAKTINFNREGTPYEKLRIGSGRILEGQDLIDAITDKIWDFAMNYDFTEHNMFSPCKLDVEVWAEELINNSLMNVKRLQPENIKFEHFLEYWNNE